MKGGNLGCHALWHWLLRTFQSYRSMNDFIKCSSTFIHTPHSFIHWSEQKMCWLREEVKVIGDYFSFYKRTYNLLRNVSILLVYNSAHHFCKNQFTGVSICENNKKHQKNRQNISVSTLEFPNVPSTNTQAKENGDNCLAALSPSLSELNYRDWNHFKSDSRELQR